MGDHTNLIITAVNTLTANADLGSLDPERFQVQDRIIRDGQRAGREFRKFLELGAEIQIVVPELHVIDCRIASMPREWRETGWKVEWHRNLGHQVFTPDAIRLHLAEEQKDGRIVRGDKLRKIIETEPVLTDNWLDFLLEHPEFIPESWKGKAIFFWGTGYRHPDGGLYVRFLSFSVGLWYWRCYWLGIDWSQSYPAAVLASS
ncbi:MAG: hypothetical protein HYW89_04565 [Candidatus Sungiibacteriota bacterium]|uniref:Uncharacterized protein n=1 Tax=Candidatus Sungiibacteriota bacterium TaxID=2750080 RepID=A0A7T5RJH0_9BACT|nr:MAG: hypothetical protein HYW89_04565 [Candidatus Sungbacteria bacterium]